MGANALPELPPRSKGSAEDTILLITPWYGGSGGGVAVSTETLVGALSRIGLRVVVLVVNGTQSERGRHGERIVSLTSYERDVFDRGLRGRLGYYRRALATGLRLLQVIRREHIRVAHFHFCVPEYNPIDWWLDRLRIPVVLTFRGSDAHQVEPGSFRWQESLTMVRRAQLVTAVSDGLLQVVREHFPDAVGKSCTVMNAIPLDVWDRLATTPPVSERDIDVLFLGNLLSIKGPDILLSAFREISRRRPGTKLLVAGSGPMEPELRAAAEQAGLGMQVVFAGRVERDDVGRLLRRARVLALPSRGEGLPLAAIEAQLFGVPVVASNVGGVPEAVEDGSTGTLFPVGDTEALANAICELLGDAQKWAEFSSNASARAAARFDPEHIAAQYAEIYERLSA